MPSHLGAAPSFVAPARTALLTHCVTPHGATEHFDYSSAELVAAVKQGAHGQATLVQWLRGRCTCRDVPTPSDLATILVGVATQLVGKLSRGTTHHPVWSVDMVQQTFAAFLIRTLNTHQERKLYPDANDLMRIFQALSTLLVDDARAGGDDAPWRLSPDHFGAIVDWWTRILQLDCRRRKYEATAEGSDAWLLTAMDLPRVTPTAYQLSTIFKHLFKLRLDMGPAAPRSLFVLDGPQTSIVNKWLQVALSDPMANDPLPNRMDVAQLLHALSGIRHCVNDASKEVLKTWLINHLDAATVLPKEPSEPLSMVSMILDGVANLGLIPPRAADQTAGDAAFFAWVHPIIDAEVTLVRETPLTAKCWRSAGVAYRCLAFWQQPIPEELRIWAMETPPPVGAINKHPVAPWQRDVAFAVRFHLELDADCVEFEAHLGTDYMGDVIIRCPDKSVLLVECDGTRFHRSSEPVRDFFVTQILGFHLMRVTSDAWNAARRAGLDLPEACIAQLRALKQGWTASKVGREQPDDAIP